MLNINIKSVMMLMLKIYSTVCRIMSIDGSIYQLAGGSI
jgi:hypothetical protein